MIRWKIFYGDGSSFSDADGGPEQAPCRNVQVLIQSDIERGREMLHSDDYYYWRRDEQRWVSNSDKRGFALEDYLGEPGWKAVKFGRDIPRETFFRIFAAAKTDAFLPPQTARLPNEKPELPEPRLETEQP